MFSIETIIEITQKDLKNNLLKKIENERPENVLLNELDFEFFNSELIIGDFKIKMFKRTGLIVGGAVLFGSDNLFIFVTDIRVNNTNNIIFVSNNIEIENELSSNSLFQEYKDSVSMNFFNEVLFEEPVHNISAIARQILIKFSYFNLGNNHYVLSNRICYFIQSQMRREDIIRRIETGEGYQIDRYVKASIIKKIFNSKKYSQDFFLLGNTAIEKIIDYIDYLIEQQTHGE